jgi:hypothetical protein
LEAHNLFSNVGNKTMRKWSPFKGSHIAFIRKIEFLEKKEKMAPFRASLSFLNKEIQA